MAEVKEFSGKHVLLGVTGGIAVYKSVELASMLVKAGAEVDVIMTDAAQKFVTPLCFEAIIHRRAFTSMWDREVVHPHHIAISERPDLVILAPATGNTLAKLAHGIADNLLTSTLLACIAPVLAAPAMNDNMWKHPATQANIKILQDRGVKLVGPESGRLASGKIGLGRMSEPETIFAAGLGMW